MAYIGREPEFGAFERQTITADGSTTTFTLNYTVGSSSSILVNVAGVVQDPTGAYAISGGGTSIVFSAAPASGDTVFIIFLGIALDSSGLLSTSSITSQTDLGGAPATGDSILIHDTSASALKEMTVANLFTSPTITTPVIAEIDATGDFTLDVEGDISLDANGADLIFKDDGTAIGRLKNSSSNLVVAANVQDKDLIFEGNDGGVIITPLTLDMSNSGAAIFSAAAYNAESTLTDASTISWNAITQPVAKVTLAGSRTLSAASGGVAGAFISLLIIQDGTGSRTVSFNAAYEFKDDTAPTLTTTAAKGDLFVFRYNGAKWLEVGRNQNLTLS